MQLEQVAPARALELAPADERLLGELTQRSSGYARRKMRVRP